MTSSQPFQEETDAQGTPTNLGGTLQLAVEGAQRWWRNFGRTETETFSGEPIPPGSLAEAAAIFGFLCGRLELEKKQHWGNVQVALNTGKQRGQIFVPGRDPSDPLTGR